VGNNAPVAQDENTNSVIASTAGATAIKALTATDTDGTVVSYTVSTLPAHGTLALGGVAVTAGQVLTPIQAGNLTYAPSGTFTGNDSFTFTATDNNAASSTSATFNIPVGNNPPTANNVTNATAIVSTDPAKAISALSGSDTDGTIVSYTVVSLPSHGTLALGGVAVTAGQVLTPAEAGSLTYAPNGAFTGNDTFTFTAKDNLNAVSGVGAFTILVGNNTPVAHDDNTNASIPSRAGVTVINPLTATDTDGTIVSYTVLSLPAHGTLALGGVAVTVNQVLTPAQAAALTYDPSGAFSGNDTFTFTATDNNGASAIPAVITIEVEKTILNAVPDPITSVVGVDKIVKVVNILENDTLNNNPLVISDVNLGVLVPDPKGVLILKPDGTIELAPSAPAGTYSLTYEICEKANASNCSSATVSVTVVAPTMTITASSYCSNNTPYVSYNVVADNFTPAGLLTINWIDSANNIVATQANMPLSGNVLWPGATVDGNNNPTDWPGWVLVNGQWIQGNDGFELTKPAVTMQFTLNPTKSIVVNYPSVTSGCNAMPTFGIKAGNEDDVTLADGLNGSLEVINVLANDKLNGVPVKPADVILKGLDLPKGITLNADGTIDVAPGTKGGSHTLTYQICEVANSSNCTTATVKIFVEVPAIAIVKTVALNDHNANGYAEAGETLTYSFTITNTGNVDLQNIVVADPLPGIVMNGGPISLAAGQSDSYSISGTYSLSQADVNTGSISNQATVSGATKSGISVSDKSDSGDLNGDKPTILELSGCVIKIFNAVSSNGDGKNERFYVQGLECYPDNTVQIYNRWGVLVFERDHYNNNDIAFRGISEGRVTIKESDGLPEGTYYYIIRYKDKQSNAHQEAGYLYLTK
ncbi:Ig-like domain-containing protein, partial [Flavobacterium sp. FlaQc-48]|uniref:Ig-like domain-containing protein n=1 Tax=Flavobacterium sp. FlaQc-48 TaxID=3374181 RepID=UPI0037577899